MAKIRWGILSTGGIARKFAEGLTFLPDAQLIAVGSRTAEAAQAFGEKYHVPHRHPSYEALASDPDVDVIYVATPHNFHYDNSRLCLEHGKAVLCEKAFTLNAAEAESLIALARQKKLFLMEAMWTRYLPAVVKLRQMVQQGAVGEVRMVAIDLGFRAEFNPQGRLFNKNLAGGALLDVGCYVVSFASMLLGTPNQVVGISALGETGVDEQSAMLLGYPGGKTALLSTALRVNSPQEAIIMGTEGMIKVSPPFHVATQLTYKHGQAPDEVISAPFQGNGYNYEAAEVMACLQAGMLESAIMPLDESLQIMRTLDAVRQQVGLRYPSE
jgi:predicted dehydrogenase